jgi:hypothetical protein
MATIALITFIFTSTFIPTAFAANDAPQTPVTTEKPAYEIRKVEPAPVETQPPPSRAEVIASSEATNAYITGINPKYIEGAIFVGALIIMSVAVASDSGSSSTPPPTGH